MLSADAVLSPTCKANPSRVVKRARDEYRPVPVTSTGRGVAVLQSLVAYGTAEEERAFMRAVVTGLTDLESGRTVTLAAARARRGLK